MNIKHSRIYLVGFMGSGKSTYGKELSKIMNYGFYDTDEEIEKETGLTVEEIFEHKGESHFRELESEIIKKTAHPDNYVISTGGGLPAFHHQMDYINSQGLTVFVKLKISVLIDWLVSHSQEKPLLKDRSGEELIRYIRELYFSRLPYYRQAKLVIDSSFMDPGLFAKYIIPNTNIK